MTLPNADRAVIEEQKIRNYLLSLEHPVGRFKAAFFRRLGYSRDEWEVLRDDLLGLARTGAATSRSRGPFGQKIEVRGTLTGPRDRAAEITTIWIIETDESIARFITAYPT